MIRKITVLLLVAGLGGCATGNHEQQASPWLIQRSSVKVPACTPLSKEHELWLGLSQKMIADGRLHAALANIEQLPNELPEARLNKAQILRQLQRPEAESLYESLLDSCLVAAGYHGLAQIAVANQAYPQAQIYLQQAIAIAPTNDAMRNDLGVVYLNLRQLEAAQFELVTALELNEGEPRAATNLVTLLLYQERLDQAAKLVSRYRLSTAQYQAAMARAERLQQADQQAPSLSPILSETLSENEVARQAVVDAAVIESSLAPVAAEPVLAQADAYVQEAQPKVQATAQADDYAQVAQPAAPIQAQTQTQAQAQDWAELIQPALPGMASIRGLNSADSTDVAPSPPARTAATAAVSKTPPARGVQQVSASSSRAIVPLTISQGTL